MSTIFMCKLTTCEGQEPCPRIPTRTPHACTWYEESKEIQEGSPTRNFIVGNNKLRTTERWENTPRMSSEVGEICCKFMQLPFFSRCRLLLGEARCELRIEQVLHVRILQHASGLWVGLRKLHGYLVQLGWRSKPTFTATFIVGWRSKPTFTATFLGVAK